MGVLLHAHYRRMGPDGQKIVMPAPVDKDTPDAPWWWDHLASQAADFRRSGFSAVLLQLGGGLVVFVPAAGAGCRIGPRLPVEAAAEAAAGCPPRAGTGSSGAGRVPVVDR